MRIRTFGGAIPAVGGVEVGVREGQAVEEVGRLAWLCLEALSYSLLVICTLALCDES